MQEVDCHFGSSGASARSRRPPAEKSAGSSQMANQQPAKSKLMSESRLDADLLANFVLRRESDDAWAFVEAMVRDGVAPRTIMATVIAPAARLLGQLWENDACDFMQVTVGLQRLQGLLRNLVPEEDRSGYRAGRARAILLLAAPGENHLLGVQMVTSLFASEGWRVERTDAEACSRRLAEQWFDAIGFSVNCERFVDDLRLMIGQARLVSQNPRLRVLVGGSIFASNPEIGKKLGADNVAPDFETAIHCARTLLCDII